MNWLITGGCGFIGTSLIKTLTNENNHNIRVLDNLTTGTREDLLEVCKYSEVSGVSIGDFNGVELVVGDILDEGLAAKVTKKADIVIHLAANTGVGPSVENPRADCMANVIGTFNYLEAARINNVPRFVFASSGAPAGEVEPPIHEELPPHPVSPYGASKLAGEGYCSAYYKTFNIQTVMLRFGNVYGPGSLHKNSIVAKFVRQALNKETLEIYGDGSQTRDFIYIDDLINALRLAVTSDNIGGEVFQIASNQETTVGEITKKMVKILNQNGIDDINVINGETRLGDVKRNYSDISKAKNKLGWQPRMNQYEGLKKTVEYFVNENF
ncbi:NAD-dependent epimerase/dehydratase family protein [Candidatus Pseudothioglobus singularis]|nr:NAD-dependent epimerase/dehydratase family protein [Candidatus Pseudothioglobus singularis]